MKEVEALVGTVKALRDPVSGCPWDLKQTHETLTKHLVEEASEVLEAVDLKDSVLLQEELGDLLIQVMLHSQIASEAGDFTFEDVVRGANEKLVRRHPHVFGDVQISGDGELWAQWERIKAEEKGKQAPKRIRERAFMPSLMFAGKVYKQIMEEGIDFDVFFNQEIALLSEQEADIIKLFMIIIHVSHENKIDAEGLLRSFIVKLVHAVNAVEVKG